MTFDLRARLDAAAPIRAAEHHLASVVTIRADGTPHSSLVNAGVLAHPLTGEPVVGFVTSGSVKRANLRARPAVSLLWRAGWRWAAVDGDAELIGPDDPVEGVDAEGLRRLLRAVFTAAGGQHDDWPGYDAAMLAERRLAVLVTPRRVYGSA